MTTTFRCDGCGDPISMPDDRMPEGWTINDDKISCPKCKNNPNNEPDIAAPYDVLDFFKAVIAAGIAPPNLQRMIIDLRIDDLPQVYYQTVGSKSLLMADGLRTLIDNAKVGTDHFEISPPAEEPAPLDPRTCPKCLKIDRVEDKTKGKDDGWFRCKPCRVTFRAGAASAGGGS